jgi:HAD superfamily hydrolase (TIGR01450 family)
MIVRHGRRISGKLAPGASRASSRASRRTISPVSVPRPEELQIRRPDRPYVGYIFDLDGTIYLGDGLLPGSQRLIDALRARQRRVLFLSNNPTSDPDRYAAKLTRLGIPATPDEIVNTVFTMTRWLLESHPDATVYPISEEPLIRALTAAGIRISRDPAEIDFVIASYDRTFTYEKLQIAFDAIWFHKRAKLVTTNPDSFCPYPGGRGQPDAAAIVAAIEACTGTTCIQNAGKPDPFMLHAALERLDLPARECVMVGDRFHTDIRMAIDAGMDSALVLTGETRAEHLRDLGAADQPTWVLHRADELLPATVWDELGWEAP